MKVSFPAMRGTIGKRQYFATVMALSEIPHLFKFNDWEQFTPELRAQRVLVKSRVPEIVKYIVDNEDSYLFSSITAAYNTDVKFKPFEEGADIGYLDMDLEDAKFLINDGQHRCAAITAALNENPGIGKERISVLLFPWESLERAQQMFTDLNRFVQKTSKSLNILYDHRDVLSGFTMEVSEQVPVFKGMIDKEKLTIPIRSDKIFTLSTLYDANEELIGSKLEKPDTKEFKDKLARAVSYWNAMSSGDPGLAEGQGWVPEGSHASPGKDQHARSCASRLGWFGQSADRSSPGPMGDEARGPPGYRLEKVSRKQSQS